MDVRVKSEEWFMLLRRLVLTGRYREAEQLLPKDPMGYVCEVLISAAAQRGDLEQAQTWAEQSLQTSAEHAPEVCPLIKELAARQQYDSALALASRLEGMWDKRRALNAVVFEAARNKDHPVVKTLTSGGEHLLAAFNGYAQGGAFSDAHRSITQGTPAPTPDGRELNRRESFKHLARCAAHLGKTSDAEHYANQLKHSNNQSTYQDTIRDIATLAAFNRDYPQAQEWLELTPGMLPHADIARLAYIAAENGDPAEVERLSSIAQSRFERFGLHKAFPGAENVFRGPGQPYIDPNGFASATLIGGQIEAAERMAATRDQCTTYADFVCIINGTNLPR